MYLIQVIKEWGLRYPLFSRFVINRISLHKFKGLPLTLLILVFFGNLLLFNELAESVENSPLMLTLDNSIAKFLFSIRSNTLATIFFYFSKLGTVPVVLAIGFCAIILFLFKKRYIYIIAILISSLGTGITVMIGKLFFHRIRPVGLSFYEEKYYSFPSGHAVIAVAFYGLIFFYFIRQVDNNKLLWTIFSVFFVLLLGFTRLYLCVHYFSDVLAGYSLGFLWLCLSISIVEWKISGSNAIKLNFQ